jgi:hypothetical protein
MTDTPELPQADDRSIVERAKAILLKPANEWPRIAASTETPGDLITRYAVPLAAIGPLATFVHGQVFGYGALGFSWKPGLVAGLGSAVATYVLGLVGVIVLALIADWLAPKFSGVSNRTAAFKLVVYGSTAAWLAGAAQLLPGLGLLGLAGLYSLYLYYLGATPVMKVPQDKAAGYTAVTIACAVVLYLVIGGVSGAFLTMMGSTTAITAPDSGKVSGALSIPGVGKVDLDKVQHAADQLEAQSKGEVKAVAPDALKDLLPASIGPFQRTGVESGAVGGWAAMPRAPMKTATSASPCASPTCPPLVRWPGLARQWASARARKMPTAMNEPASSTGRCSPKSGTTPIIAARSAAPSPTASWWRPKAMRTASTS